MTATIGVLGSNGDTSPGEIARYFTLHAQPKYYTEGGEKPGQWYGQAARALGLTGAVGEMPLTNVLSGRSADGARQLVQIQQQKGGNTKRRKRRDRAPGFDLTFSLPKSLSVLYATGSEQVRLAIDLAMDRATRRVIQYAESTLPLGRRGKGGSIQESASLVVAMFDHAVNRHLEPQRHRHCVIANMCQMSDGGWRSIQSKNLHRWTRTLGPMFRSEFAAELTKVLPIELKLPLDAQGNRKTAFEVVGVPEALCERWSSRRAEIEAMVAGDEDGLGGTSTAAARQKAALYTRHSKQKTPPQAELHEKWKAEAAEYGFDEKSVDDLCHKAQPVDHEQAYQAARHDALSALTTQESDFSERQFIQKLFEAIQHQGVPMDFVLERITQDLAQAPDIVRLKERDHEWRFTTKEMWDLEEAMLKDAERLQSSPGATVPAEVIDCVLATRPTITEEQAKAVKDLLADGSAIRYLAGEAGTGKSYTLDAVRSGLEAAGYHVLAGALSGVAAEELAAKANVPARTVASYLWHLGEDVKFANDSPAEPLQPRSQSSGDSRTAEAYRPREMPFLLNERAVLILDECGMLPTKATAAILRHAVAAKASVILVGDPAQVQPVDAGALLPHLMKLRPQAVAVLKENQRQLDPADRTFVKDVRAGRADSALENVKARDRLVLGNNQADAIRKLVKSWVKHGGCERPGEHLIFTHTRAEARVINRLCQQQRQQAGLVDGKRQVTIGKQSFGKGDSVLFHRPITEHSIRNGYSGVVLRVNQKTQTVTIRLDNRSPDRDPVVTIPLSQIKRDGISHSYARTTSKGQGQTVDNAYLLMGGPMTNRETAYTQSTRGKLATFVFVDKLQAGEELRDLAKAMEKSKAKGLAHDLGLRLEIERNQKP